MKICTVDYIAASAFSGYDFQRHLQHQQQVAAQIDGLPWTRLDLMARDYQFDLEYTDQAYKLSARVAARQAPVWANSRLVLLVATRAGERILLGTTATPVLATSLPVLSRAVAQAAEMNVTFSGSLALYPPLVV